MMPVIHTGDVCQTATPGRLYELFMDSTKHSAATGMRAKMSRKAGGKWTAFDGTLSGRNLILIPNQMIVQTWRSTHFKKGDPDSILVVTFEKALSGGARVEVFHVGVPEHDHKGVTEGWVKYYWEPWRKYLSPKPPKKQSKTAT